ncbi:MAG: ATP-binding cassette domain-containing protein [Spirochaetales bacterium]|nr:ATP-binding cassette domain-containing protein [Spirochaetales bacterium]
MVKDIFRAEDLSFQINSQLLLRNLNFSIWADRVTTIIGPSGSGKSTLLKQLNHLLSPSAGKLYYNNKDVFQWQPRELRREVIYVSQHPYLFPGTVQNNLEYMGPKKIEEQLGVLEQVHLGADYLGQDVGELSSGEAQRVNLARAILLNPRVFLLDEPTSNLDIANQRIIEELITKILSQSSTIIMISHDLAQIKRIAQDVIMLSDGSIVDQLDIGDFLIKYSDKKIEDFFEDKTND